MKRFSRALAVLSFTGLLIPMTQAEPSSPAPAPSSTSSIVLGGGCFWCVEALYETIDGVTAVVSGYAGGNVPDPSYEAVCSGRTGHAEVVRIEFDPDKVSLRELIDFFWEAHDPTSLNRQGADVGTHYRSIILYADPAQEAVARESLEAVTSRFSQPVVTELKPLGAFYPAEKYHQDYFRNNPDAPYCRYVIAPKMKKLES
jgi:peptide-methionine (S)-S-oxide reductase